MFLLSLIFSIAWACGSGSVQVGSLCVDQDLTRQADGRLEGYMNRIQCQASCVAKKERLPTWAEWQLACDGTKNSDCQPNGAKSPLQDFARYIEPKCNGSLMYTSVCMSDPRINANYLKVSDEPKNCVSPKNVRNCVGILGQWVSDDASSVGGHKGNGMFVGGLYAQPKSSDHYITIAHYPGYSDYSIGCRCVN